MTIEFRCGTCQKLLRTGDDKAGATAKCPQCGSPVLVPGPAAAAGAPASDAPAEAFGEMQPEEEADEWAPPASAGPRPSGPTRPCPMCGQQILAAATRCRFCGEQLSSAGPRERRSGSVDAGNVISASWRIFQSRMGICMGLVILGGILNFGTAMGAQFVGEMTQRELIQGNQNNLPLALVLGFLIQQVPPLLVGSFFSAGVQLGLLKVARGENAEIGDLFAGGPYYLRNLGMTFLFQLMTTIGFLLCIVPGVILALMFWPYGYVLVDRNPPGIDALSEAKDITQNTWGQVFVLAIAVLGINILGALALCVGLFFTAPLTTLMFAVAYCHMTGQATAEE